VRVRVRKRIALVAVVVFILSFAVEIYAGSQPPGPGTSVSCIATTRLCTYGDPNGNLTQIQTTGAFRPYNGSDNAAAHIISFDVLGIESVQPPSGVVFTVTTSGSLAVKFIGSKPTVTCAQCSSSYSGTTETVTYAGGKTDTLTVVWNVITGILPEPGFPTLLYQDNFQYPYQELSNGWIVDSYASSVIGAYTQGGFLVFNGPSSPKSVHIGTASFSPSGIDMSGNAPLSSNTLIERKLTIAGYPFKQAGSNTASLKVGLTPLLTSGGFPGTTPYGSPYYDTTGSCNADGSANDHIGSEYIYFNNAGGIVFTTCGDGSFNKITMTSVPDPTLFTIFTLETNAVYCGTCTDNAQTGSQWAWMRVYQENSAGKILNDQSLNFTSNVAPLFQNSYVFLTLASSSGSTRSSFNLVNLQNHFTPVQVIPTTGIPPPTASSPGLVGLFAEFASLFGDITIGGYITFGIFIAITLVFFVITRSVMLTSVLGYSITGAFSYMGLISPGLLYLMIIAMTFLLGRAVMKLLGIGGGGDEEGSAGAANLEGVG
jgi:hypothetical protein